MDPIVVSFKDCPLRQSDIDTLKAGEWINDAVISFVFEVLSHRGDDDGNPIAFWQPAAVELLCSLAESMGSAVTELLPTIERAEWLLLPVSDRFASTGDEGKSGSHWSTLLVHYDAAGAVDSIVHYDSLRPRNRLASQHVYDGLMHAGLVARQTNAMLKQDAWMRLQTNASDCGVYPLLFARMLATKETGVELSSRTANVTPHRVASLRIKLHGWLQRWAAISRKEQDQWRDLTDVEAVIGAAPFSELS